MLTKKFVKDGASQFQNYHVNFHKFQALFSMKLSQLSYAVTRFEQDGFRKMLKGAHKTQRIASVLTSLSDTTGMAINFSITSH
jgi:hypothetical protein